MKKLSAALVLLMLLSPFIAHSDHGVNSSDTAEDSSSDPGSGASSFSQLYPEYRSGTIWVVLEVSVVLGATVLAFLHYFRKSESSSLKEFIREEIV